jgi:putative salt-induced outer membrane protein
LINSQVILFFIHLFLKNAGKLCDKKKMKIFILILFFTPKIWAQENQLKGSTEASSVVISGNTENESYSLKTDNSYSLSELNIIKLFGKYVRSVADGSESAKSWEAGTRYERVFTEDRFSGYLQHKAEHDPYNGVFIQRDSSDIGAKYNLTKTNTLNWFVELGYQYSNTYLLMQTPRKTASFIRAYTEVKYVLTETTTSQIWYEHLAPLKKSDKLRSNAEISLSVTISKLLSLKSAFLLNHNEANVAPSKKDTTTWTTALVANY